MSMVGVIVVSREPEVRGKLARALTQLKSSVLCFGDWRHAGQSVKQERPAVLVVDAGYEEAVKTAARLEPPPLVVALCRDKKEEVDARKAGVHDTVSAPFDGMEPAWTVACAWQAAGCGISGAG
jgi:DNA-binding response OmpR family regulator